MAEERRHHLSSPTSAQGVGERDCRKTEPTSCRRLSAEYPESRHHVGPYDWPLSPPGPAGACWHQAPDAREPNTMRSCSSPLGDGHQLQGHAPRGGMFAHPAYPRRRQCRGCRPPRRCHRLGDARLRSDAARATRGLAMLLPTESLHGPRPRSGDIEDRDNRAISGVR